MLAVALWWLNQRTKKHDERIDGILKDHADERERLRADSRDERQAYERFVSRHSEASDKLASAYEKMAEAHNELTQSMRIRLQELRDSLPPDPPRRRKGGD